MTVEFQVPLGITATSPPRRGRGVADGRYAS